MNDTLSETLKPECIKLRSQASSKNEVLDIIARLIHENSSELEMNVNDIVDVLKNREKLGSTGFGDGIAIPHGRFEKLQDFMVGLISLENPVDFDSIDGEPVNTVMFIAAPVLQNSAHIKLLSVLSRFLIDKKNRDMIVSAEDEDHVYTRIVQWIKQLDTSKNLHGRHLFNILVNNERALKDIVIICESLGADPVTIQVVQSPERYVMRMPLFMGLWEPNQNEHLRNVSAVLDSRLRNEFLRRISNKFGPLDKCDDLFITSHEIDYYSGNLQILP